MVTCYPSPGKRKAMKICRAFAEGCGGRIAPIGQRRLEDGAAFFYGWTEHTAPLIAQCKEQGREWYYADNAYYFGRGRYFRITRGALMQDGSGNAGPERFAQFGIRVKPWRRQGGHILIATQSELFYWMHGGTTRAAWTNRTIQSLRAHTDREIRVRHKPAPHEMAPEEPHARTLEGDLRGAWALVTHSSSAGVKALIEGVPVFSLSPSMCSRMGHSDPALIEHPAYPDDREPWLWNLAANQWTREEMCDGTAWRDLRKQAEFRAA